jgi:DNA-binding GntR family transcriptional regulator
MAKNDAQSAVASLRVADIIGERILAGKLPPGTRLKQDELAAELNMSRIPVRDALRILETRGLVSLRANVGARVSSLTIRDMETSYRIREHLEPMLLTESMPQLTDADIAGMLEVKAQLEETLDVDQYMPLSRQFHWTAFSRHQAPLLAQIVERLWDTTHVYRRAYAKIALQDEERRKIMCAERGLLFASIARREFELAPMMLRMHINRTHLSLLKHSELFD